MHAAVVIPCLDEQATLAATCASLGFGAHPHSTPPRDTLLVLVDNGSTDRTPEVMAMIQNQARGRVLLAHEAERGYVPPRDRGVRVVHTHFEDQGLAPNDVLVIQADADTDYAPGYVEELVGAASASGSNTLLEGIARPPPAFRQLHPGYHRLAEQADLVVEPLLVDEADEIVVDDQVAAYRLGDYLAWGGHRREYDAAGDEIHAETSRLYLRARMTGARRVRVTEAEGFPSRRKVESDPIRYFATSGFPREARWIKRWRAPLPPAEAFAAFERPDTVAGLSETIFQRQAHTLLLFGFIPAYVCWLHGRPERRSVLDSPLGALVSAVSNVTAADVASHPGALFAACLPLLESHRHVFELCLEVAP